MITRNTKKILSFLLRELELKNINQISRELKISVGSSFKILKDLEKRGFVNLKIIGNGNYYKINLKNKEAIKFCELILLEEKSNLRSYAKIYADEVEGFRDADLIILFGSVLYNKKFNDVDILFISKNARVISKFCLNISQVRSKPIVPLILDKKDLIREIKNEKDSILNIIKTGVILRGENVFLEVIRNARL